MAEQQVVFRLGEPKRPDIKHDNGFLDKYSRRPPTEDEKEKYAKWLLKLAAGEVANVAASVLGDGYLPDALPAYKHWALASGTDRTFSYERFTSNDRSGSAVFNYSRLLARQAAEQLYRNDYEPKMRAGGTTMFQMTSSAIAVGGKDPRFPYPTVPLQIGNRRVGVLVDTGAQDLALFESQTRGALPDVQVVGQETRTTMRGPVVVKRAEFHELTLGTTHWTRREGLFTEPASNLFHGALGPRWLGAKRMGFDLEHKVISWEK